MSLERYPANIDFLHWSSLLLQVPELLLQRCGAHVETFGAEYSAGPEAATCDRTATTPDHVARVGRRRFGGFSSFRSAIFTAGMHL